MSTPHTLAGFKGSFFVATKRHPTEQEIFDAGMRAGRDLKWPEKSKPSPALVKVLEKIAVQAQAIRTDET